MDAPVITPEELLETLSEKELLLAILQQLHALNRTIAKAYAQPTPATCCDDVRNRLNVGAYDAPDRWMCRVCGANGDTG